MSTKSKDARSHGSEKHSFNLTGHLTVFPLELIDKAFSRFRHKNVVHLSRLKDGLNILELWHGVTYAFKDLSLSCTGQFLQYFLEKKQKHVNILVGEYDSLEERFLGRSLPGEPSSYSHPQRYPRMVLPHNIQAIPRWLLWLKTSYGASLHLFLKEQ